MSILTNEYLGNFWRWSGVTVIVSYPTHCHVCVWWLGLVSVVGWDYCLGSIVSCVTSTKCGRTDVDNESSNFIWSSQSAAASGYVRPDTAHAPPPYWTMIRIVRGFTRRAIGQSLWTTRPNNFIPVRSLINFSSHPNGFGLHL